MFFAAPYTAGYPATEATTSLPPGGGATPGDVSRTAWAIPQDGTLSLGAGGGLVWWDGESFPPARPMPDRWFFGDAIFVSAGIEQFADIYQFTLTGPKTLSVGAQVSTWKAIAAQDWFRLIYCFPGQNSSAGRGMVAVIGSATLTVTARKGSFAVDASTWMNFLYGVVHSTDDNGSWTVDQGDFAPSFEVDTALAIPAGTQSAWIDLNVEFLCLRIGVDDPGGGFVGVDFREDRAKPIFNPDPYWMRNSSLSVDLMAAHIG
jgi:hypothetical protein